MLIAHCSWSQSGVKYLNTLLLRKENLKDFVCIYVWGGLSWLQWEIFWSDIITEIWYKKMNVRNYCIDLIFNVGGYPPFRWLLPYGFLFLLPRFHEENRSVCSKSCRLPKSILPNVKKLRLLLVLFVSHNISLGNSACQKSRSLVLQKNEKMAFCCCGVVIMICTMESQVHFLDKFCLRRTWKLLDTNK